MLSFTQLLVLWLGLWASLPLQAEVAEEGSTALLPVIFYTRDTGMGLGGFLVSNLDRPAAGDPSQVLGLLSYTSRRQTIGLVEPRLFSEDRAWEYGGRLYAQDYPSQYFGREGEPLAEAENFKEQRLQLDLRIKYKEAHDLFAELEAGTLASRFQETETTLRIHDEFERWGSRFQQSSLTFALGYDSRPSRIRPSMGLLLRTAHRRSITQSPKTHLTHALNSLEVRHYISWEGDHTLALQVYIAEVDPQALPFFLLQGLGGSALLRGYAASQFRDYAVALAQSEYRHLWNQRWGYHSFFGIGDTAKHTVQLSTDRLKASGGFGLDYLVDLRSKQNFRLDIGIGEASYGLYLLFGNAF